jgi:hypothetical protein
MSNQEFLVRDYNEVINNRSDSPTLEIIRGDAIFETLDHAKATHRKIAVYSIGKCVIDWS